MKTFKSYIAERCWDGHKPVPGKKPYSPGSCVKEEEQIDELFGFGKPKKTPEQYAREFEARKANRPENKAKPANVWDATRASEKRGMNEDWQKVNKADRTDGLSQKAVDAYRRENPGSKLKTAVTEKNPTGKRAARRKSFCSRMGGMKKRLTNPENARDPDSPINKALRRWNC